MLGDNMKQKLGSRARGAPAAKSAEPGFHLHPISHREKMAFPMQEKVLMGLNTRLFGLLYTDQMRGVLLLLEEHREDRTSAPGVNIAFVGAQVPLLKIRWFHSSCIGAKASWRKCVRLPDGRPQLSLSCCQSRTGPGACWSLVSHHH